MPWSGLPRRGLRKVIPASTMLADDAISRTLSTLPAGVRIADLGAGGRRITPNTFTVDGVMIQGTDLVCDLHDVPLADASFDVVFCTGTLEHVRDPHRVGREIVRLLKRGGLAHIDVPFLQCFHADPDDYWRWTLPGLRLLCEGLGLREVRSGVHLGPGSAVNWTLSEYARIALGDGAVGRVAWALTRYCCVPLLHLDRVLVRRASAYRAASGVYFVGRKPGEQVLGG